METTRQTNDIEARVDEILSRGVGTFVDPEGVFRKNLIAKAKGELTRDVVIKFGIDPNRPDIHLGHAVVLRTLRQLQDLGCKIIFLVGDFTAQIGDPTGKSKVRPEVEQAEIEHNVNTYLAQVGKILLLNEKSFSWIRNSDWFYGVTDISAGAESNLEWNIKDKEGVERVIPVEPNSFVGKALLFDKTRMQTTVLKRPAQGVTFATILSILRRITFAQLIERDMFQERITGGEPLFMHEMLYPVMQGIDSDILANIYGSCDLEVGGTDQTFNMLMGRRVMEMTKKEVVQAVLSFELLVGLDGKEKMSKSLDNYVGITDEPNDMFGKLMSIPDHALATYFALCTYTQIGAVEKIVKDLKSGKSHPKEVKMNLAEQVVEIYHGQGMGKSAREYFTNTFQNKEIPDNIPEVRTKKGTLLADALLAEKIVESKTDFRRLLTDGAIRKDGEEKLTDPHMTISETLTLKIGKHRFVTFIID